MTDGNAQPAPTLSGDQLRHREMAVANLNAGLWATGNGLLSTTLVVYLAIELGATGLATSFILAAPRFAGLLRLGVPALMAHIKTRKQLCIASYILGTSSCASFQPLPRLRHSILRASLSRC